jgi:hypothetical protein
MSDLAVAAARLAQLATFYDAAPHPPPSPRRVDRTLAEIRRSIHPLTLPNELDEFWRAWDPGSFGKLLPFPCLIDPSTALALWRHQRHPIGPVPSALFPIASQRSCYLHIELRHPDWFGPAVWFHAADGGDYELQALSLGAYLHQAADAIVDGLVEQPVAGRPFLGSGQGDEWDHLVARALDAAEVVAPEWREPQDWSEPANWPERFRRAPAPSPTTTS